MELTRELWALVEKSCQKAQESTSETCREMPAGLLRTLEEQQTIDSLLSTSETLNEAAADALHRASTHIRDLLSALDSATPSSTTHLLNSLLLSDAELLSVSSSWKAFAETLNRVARVTERRLHGRSHPTAPPTGSGNSTSEGVASGSAGSGLVAHLLQMVTTTERRLSAKRLQVALAKEELALYRSELSLFGRCGVIACSEIVMSHVVACQVSVESDGQAAGKGEEGLRSAAARSPLPPASSKTTSSLSRTTTPKPSRSGFGTTFRVVDGMMQKAAETVKAAGSHADSALQVALTGGHAAARHLLQGGAASSGNSGMSRLGRAGSADTRVLPLPPPTMDELTKEEETRLEEQGQALLQLQHEATAQDAKAVEASIRELSQLTSLMNEQVVLQSEKFSVLVRNTEAAQTNVKKAVEEVNRPLNTFWNPNRQLIALLWACMLLLLAVNSVMR